MNDVDRDRDLQDLRLLDPARDPRPETGQGHAAQSMLTAILDEPSGSAAGGPDGRRGWARWVLAGGVAAAVVVGVVLAPPWGTPEHAFATWTPVPEEVPATADDQIAEQCSNELAMEVLEQEVVLAEERGRVTFGLLSRAGFLSHCLLIDGTRHLSGGGVTGGRGLDAELAATEVQTILATAGGNEESAYTTVTGRVGEDVVGIEVHPRGPIEEPGALPEGALPESVTATVEDGYYAAWWPGVSVENIDITIQLADGTVVSNVPAFGR